MTDLADSPSAAEVLRLIAQRRESGSRPGRRGDARRLALVVEGGGIRGAITAGMVIALEHDGLLPAFDDVYGASAGALNGAWFVAGAATQGLPGWADPRLRAAAMRRRNVLRGRPLVDGRHLTDVIYEELTPLPFGRLLESPVGFHPIATDAATGRSADLARYVRDTRTLKLALRASTALPLLSGPPVRLGGRQWFDAGLAEPVPYRTAIQGGATHVLVLRSRRAGDQRISEGDRTERLVARYLARHSRPLADAFRARSSRIITDDRELERLEATRSLPSVLSVRPAADTPSIGRLERDHERVRAGIAAGQEAMMVVLDGARLGVA